MRLFAIRKQRGELLILSADNEAQAVKNAGLDMDAVQSVMAQLRAQGSDINTRTVIEGGIGPQFYEIRELPEIRLGFKLTEIGDFELDDIDLGTREIVFGMYPVIDAVTDTLAEKCPGPLLSDEDRLALRQFMASVVDQERRRLQPSPDLLIQ